MIYNKFKDLALSALGQGFMRLPLLDGNPAHIDMEKAQELVDRALAQGINYFDTAWMYHGGNSEAALGRALSRHPRDSFFLATKFPGNLPECQGKVAEIFEQQLNRCGVDYFDFYLLHNVNERNIDAYLDPANGICQYLLEQKAAGRLRHLGFSTHGDCGTVAQFLEARGADMEFCQIQLNWLDWTFLKAKDVADLLTQENIPIWVMEPLRGGKLASLAPDKKALLTAVRPEDSVPLWGFRFLHTLPNVTMVLSGMSTPEQIEENVRAFSVRRPLGEEEWAALMSVAERIQAEMATACTGCGYCLSHCPCGLDIPRLLYLYNEFNFVANSFIASSGLQALGEDKGPAACQACHSCEGVCPQQVAIAQALADFAARTAK